MHHFCKTNGTDNETSSWDKNCTNFTLPQIGYDNMKSLLEIMRITNMFSYSVIMALSLVGNSTIIGVVLRNKSLRTKANVLIVNMAVSDLLATLFELPRRLYIASTNSFQWETTSVLAQAICKLAPFMREVSCSVSIFSMVAVAMDRFYAIVTPLTEKPRLLKHKVIIPMIWISAMTIYAIYFYAFQLVQYPGRTLCREMLTSQQKQIFDTSRFITVIAIPFLTVTYLYSSIAYTMARRPMLGTTTTRRRRQNTRIIKLAVSIVAFFIALWTPYYIFLLLVHFGRQQLFELPITTLFILGQVFTTLTYVSFAINPIICVVFNTNFRKHVL